KVLMQAAGRPLLAHMIERIRAAPTAERIVIATTTERRDDAIVTLCQQLEVDCFRGHPLDCLDRHYQIALLTVADAVVKIPSDCPLIDPRAIDRVLTTWHECERPCDFLSNLHPASWPDGNDVEVMSTAALRAAWNEATDPFDREHTTPFIWSRPTRFRIANVTWETGLDYSQRYRWVVDWFEDYSVVREIIEQLSPREGAAFGVDAIVQLMKQRPDLVARNALHRGYSHLSARPNAYVSKENTR
ncbi:MAG TPA: NTP transferase domain-containing protein, partial [Polyangiales bacterium]|nr:NTP transferase domain-containing protein [Polyangiales bacterium]